MSKDHYKDMFAGVETREVTLSMLAETYLAAVEICRAQGWDEREGLLNIFATGLAFTNGQLQLERVNAVADDCAALAEEVERLKDRMVHFEAMYAVMKFRAFNFAQDNRLMELQLSGLRAEKEILERYVAGLNAAPTPDALPSTGGTALPPPASGEAITYRDAFERLKRMWSKPK